MGHHEADETYLAIGRFIFEFSQLEYALRIYIAEKCDLSEDVAMVIVSHDFSMLCTIATKVLPDPTVDGSEKGLSEIIKECRSINDIRVRVSHGLWTPYKRGGSVRHISRSLKETISDDQAQVLAECADRIAELRRRLDGFMWGDVS